MKYLMTALLFSSFGCATIIQPGPDRISVDSRPEGAKIYLDDKIVGVTPMVVELPRDSEAVFRIEKEGYESTSVDRDKVMSGWVMGNLILGGPIGIAIDLAAHNQGHYSSEPITVNLAEKANVPTRAGASQ